MQLYRHSGTMPLIGIPVVVVVGAIAAGILGFAYSFATVYCPVVYGNFLLTALLGLGIGWAVAMGTRLGKIRNAYVAGTYGLAFGLVGLYVAWAADLIARIGGQGGPGWLELAQVAFQPSVLWEYIQVFYDRGFWSISHHGQHADAVKGVFLVIVWLAEGGVILICSTACAFTLTASLPFCERCNRWTVVEKAVRRLLPRGTRPDSAQRAMAGDVDALLDLLRASGDPYEYLQLDLASCPTCQESSYLSIQFVRRTLDKKGKAQVSKTVVLKNLVLDPADIPRIRQAGRDPAEFPASPESPSLPVAGESPPANQEPPQGKNAFFDFLDEK
jgi:hypothetical protein